jgi:hypothetical protein
VEQITSSHIFYRVTYAREHIHAGYFLYIIIPYIYKYKL